MDGYSVAQLARLAGVSVRTLHHYDSIGLLVPDARTGAGYRRYGRDKLERLQQILFFRELDLPLEDIARVLDDSSFDPEQALRRHRSMLEAKLGRIHRLLDTLDRTIAQYTGGDMLTDEELYAGFPKEQVAEIRREARERWGQDRVEESERRARGMTKEQWQAVGAEGEAVARDMALLLGRDPKDAEVQAVIARHHAWVSHFWTPNAEAYRGLGEMYVEDERFRAFYDRYQAGLADFMKRAMAIYSEQLPHSN